MADIALDLVDPVLTANVYCSDFLDPLIAHVIAPLSARLTVFEGSQRSFLWFARYQRGGKHLKVRFHGPPETRGDVQADLESSVRAFFTSLPAPKGLQRDCHAGQFPIDIEDECTVAYPDYSILWTHYRRVPGIMGRHPMSDDLRHAAAFCHCLGIGSAIILERFRPEDNGNVPTSQRIALALKFFASAIFSFGLPRAGFLEYLYYHRDWLLTCFNVDIARACAQFDRRIQNNPAMLARLRLLMAADAQESRDSISSDLYHQWQECLADLFHYMVLRAGHGEFIKNPYMKDQIFATPFKLLHAHANQLGVGFVNEGYLCQLLIRACEPVERSREQERFPDDDQAIDRDAERQHLL